MNYAIFGIVLIIVWFFLPLVCGSCLPCEGVDAYNPFCQAAYSTCQGGVAVCGGIISGVRLIVLIVGVFMGIIGMLQFMISRVGVGK